MVRREIKKHEMSRVGFCLAQLSSPSRMFTMPQMISEFACPDETVASRFPTVS